MVKTLIYQISILAAFSFVFKAKDNLGFVSNSESAYSIDSSSHKTKSIPVLNINIYIMGREEMTKEVSLAVGDNIEYLNQEFDNHVKFNFDGLYLDPVQANLPDLFDKFFEADSDNLDAMFKPFEEKGGINVYVFDTYIRKGESVALSGFTPRLKSGQESYYLNSPTFDRVFISYEGLFDKSTLVHEIGHFLGLYHPWELNNTEKHENGLFNKNIENQNHMSYSKDVHEFTSEQLSMMRMNALKYRKYLCHKIIKHNARA